MVNLPQVSISTDLSEGMCFGCGKNNPIGLRLEFKVDGDGVRAEFTPARHYQGWPDIVHGGILISLIDEAMGYAAHFKGITCLTARIEVELKRMVRVGEPLVITSRIMRNSRKLIETSARVSLPDGTLVAEGRATQYVVNKNPEDGSSGGRDNG